MFKSKQLSEIWPSENPNDIPFTEFICKICGCKMEIQSCGSRFIGQPSFEENIKEQLTGHLLKHTMDELLKDVVLPNKEEL